MPIQVQIKIEVFDQETYHALNHRVLRVVFDVQNDFGRFLRHTHLRHIQWINLNHHHIEFRTLINPTPP